MAGNNAPTEGTGKLLALSRDNSLLSYRFRPGHLGRIRWGGAHPHTSPGYYWYVFNLNVFLSFSNHPPQYVGRREASKARSNHSGPQPVERKSHAGRSAGTDVSDLCISCRNALTKVIYSQAPEIDDPSLPMNGVLGQFCITGDVWALDLHMAVQLITTESEFMYRVSSVEDESSLPSKRERMNPQTLTPQNLSRASEVEGRPRSLRFL